MLPDFTSLSAVLAWLAIGGGAPYLVMKGFAYLAEMWPGWHNLPKWVKTLIPPVLAVVVAFGANFALQFADIIKMISPYWILIVQVIIAWVGSQTGYMETKRAAYGAKYSNIDLKG